MDSIKSGFGVVFFTYRGFLKQKKPVTMSAKTVQQVRPVETERA